MDEPAQVVVNFIQSVAQAVEKLTQPVEEINSLISRWLATGDPAGTIAVSINPYFESFSNDIDTSSMISDQTKKDIKDKLALIVKIGRNYKTTPYCHP